MGYKALVTLDLDVTTEQREKFYNCLNEKHWTKISKLTTAWTVTFTDSSTRESAVLYIEESIKTCKANCRIITRIDYAIQLDKNDLVIKNC